jgi:hypothetical protein
MLAHGKRSWVTNIPQLNDNERSNMNYHSPYKKQDRAVATNEASEMQGIQRLVIDDSNGNVAVSKSWLILKVFP